MAVNELDQRLGFVEWEGARAKQMSLVVSSSTSCLLNTCVSEV